MITLNQDVAGVHSGFVGMGHYAMGVEVAQGMAEQLGGKGKIVVSRAFRARARTFSAWPVSTTN